MCFWVVFLALSTFFDPLTAPELSSLVLFLISEWRRSRIGRTEPLRFFSVSRWALAIPYVESDFVRIRGEIDLPMCLSVYSRRDLLLHLSFDQSGGPVSMDH